MSLGWHRFLKRSSLASAAVATASRLPPPARSEPSRRFEARFLLLACCAALIGLFASRAQALDAELDVDGDGLSNSREAALGTDPLEADTDRDGLDDAVDPAPLSRAYIAWGEPRHTISNAYV